MAKRNSEIKKPTLKQTLKMAETYWEKFGHLTLFPSKDSYIAYVKDIYEKIRKMSLEEYQRYVGLNTQCHVDRLKRLEQNLLAKKSGRIA